MAENTQNDLMGKKIFFINPTYPIRNYIVSALRNEELEVYVIDNYKLAKNSLIKNPGSLCFIHIDSELTLNGWLVFLEEFATDKDLKTITLGIFSDKVTDKEKAYIMEKINPQGGLHKAGTSPQKLLESVKETLVAAKAKGRRQYVRANCLNQKSSELFWTNDNTMVQMKLVDISTSSAATKVQKKDLDYIKSMEKSVIHGATLNMGGKQYLIDFLIYGVHQRGDSTLMVALFLQDSIKAIKDEIQDYVFDVLQKQLLESIELYAPDQKEYNKLGKQLKLATKDGPEAKTN